MWKRVAAQVQGYLKVHWTMRGCVEEHTFGGEAYAQFMGTRSFSPRERPAIRFFVSSDLAYLALENKRSHDFGMYYLDVPPASHLSYILS